MKTAIYPGSFDPMTNGHLDIIKRALKIFDSVIVAIGENGAKSKAFSVKERVEMAKMSTQGLPVKVESYAGLLADYVKEKKISTIIRGIRAISDFDHEFQLSVINRDINPEIETVFFMTDKEYFFLSSSAVKEIAVMGGDPSPYVPEPVVSYLKKLVD